MSVDIKILGPNCPNCQTALEVVQRVVDRENFDADVTKVVDIEEIARDFGIVTTPAVVVDGKVLHAGSIPDEDTVFNWLNND